MGVGAGVGVHQIVLFWVIMFSSTFLKNLDQRKGKLVLLNGENFAL